MPRNAFSRRRLAALAATSLPLLRPSGAHAQADWPNRPITVVAPYPPGGTTDLSIRPLIDPLTRILGQPVVVENRAGAGGAIGTEGVTRARPDGHTLLAYPTAVMTISQHMVNLAYDPATALVQICMTSIAYGVIAAHPSVPFRDIPGLIAHARANPNALRFGSAGPGTITQLSGELFAEVAGIRIEHVPYRGSAPSMTDLLGGRVQLLFDAVAMPAIMDGRILALATIAETRNPALPNVPTLTELGLERAQAIPWYGLAAPAGTPAPIVQRISDAWRQALALPEVATGMAAMGMTPVFEGGETFANRVVRERAVFGDLIRRLGLRA